MRVYNYDKILENDDVRIHYQYDNEDNRGLEVTHDDVEEDIDDAEMDRMKRKEALDYIKSNGEYCNDDCPGKCIDLPNHADTMIDNNTSDFSINKGEENDAVESVEFREDLPTDAYDSKNVEKKADIVIGYDDGKSYDMERIRAYATSKGMTVEELLNTIVPEDQDTDTDQNEDAPETIYQDNNDDNVNDEEEPETIYGDDSSDDDETVYDSDDYTDSEDSETIYDDDTEDDNRVINLDDDYED